MDQKESWMYAYSWTSIVPTPSSTPVRNYSPLSVSTDQNIWWMKQEWMVSHMCWRHSVVYFVRIDTWIWNTVLWKKVLKCGRKYSNEIDIYRHNSICMFVRPATDRSDKLRWWLSNDGERNTGNSQTGWNSKYIIILIIDGSRIISSLHVYVTVLLYTVYVIL